MRQKVTNKGSTDPFSTTMGKITCPPHPFGKRLHKQDEPTEPFAETVRLLVGPGEPSGAPWHGCYRPVDPFRNAMGQCNPPRQRFGPLECKLESIVEGFVQAVSTLHCADERLGRLPDSTGCLTERLR